MNRPPEAPAASAEAALNFVESGQTLGLGTGRAAEAFVTALGQKVADGLNVRGVPTSQRTETLARELGIPLVTLAEAGQLDVTFDGADEVDPGLDLIKGYGGALVREKIVAAGAKDFICIVDGSKKVKRLGAFPLPVEVIPMARSYVARKLVGLGGRPEYREGFVTDNGNIILDVHNLDIVNPLELEKTLNNITGVVTNGLFALRPADVVLVGEGGGVSVY